MGSAAKLRAHRRGRQFTDDFDSSTSVGVMAWIRSSAQGWNTGGSSGVVSESNVPSAAGSTPKRPLTPWPAPFGNQCPDRSGRPSANRGGGPPGGITPIVYSVSAAVSWALTGRESAHTSPRTAVHVTP